MSGIQQMLLGGAPAVAANYIEDVFSTYLYTGNFNYLTITNGIDLLNKGGMVWTKSRTNSATTARNNHFVLDSARGWTSNSGKYINTNTTSAESATEVSFIDPLATGYKLGQATYGNDSALTYASWTFRKQPKFFDVVTYTGDGGTSRTISHNLGSTPGAIFIKSTSSSSWSWVVYHRSLGSTKKLYLNTTDAELSENGNFGGLSPTSTTFGVGYNATNENGTTYVAYLFAHDAGGFGAAGTDNVISCGSYTTDVSGNATVSLGYEPQFTLQKASSTTGNWFIADNMRGMPVGAAATLLRPNLSDAESTGATISPTATGFSVSGFPTSTTYIYIAIRRGPMKTPTSGTSVYNAITRTGTGSAQIISGIGFAPDSILSRNRGTTTFSYGGNWFDRLRGSDINLLTWDTGTESNSGGTLMFNSPNGSAQTTAWSRGIQSSIGYLEYYFLRAPGFFDVVCYTGTGLAITVSHNLGVAPELMIVKCRNTASTFWPVYHQFCGNTKYLFLNQTGAVDTANYWNNTSPTSSVFSVGGLNDSGENNYTYVAYLFATVAGVSKVGSYTGNGSSQTINCGFTAGSRFVLIKRTDSTGGWYVFDSARGIVAGNDPYLLLNSTAAEVTTYDAVDTDNSGFVVNNDATNYPINVNNATYIFLAIA